MREFFARLRGTAFGGSLSQGQVDGLNKIVAYAVEHGYADPRHVAYVLATAHHETAGWLQPIREGAHRFGKDYTDAQAQRAVASIHAKGIIRTNYALPINGRSYYGRGLVQITWIDNYRKFEPITGLALVDNPDLALTWEAALPILFIGMRDGLFRQGKSLAMLDTGSFRDARDIVNGDVSRNGQMIATLAEQYLHALEGAWT